MKSCVALTSLALMTSLAAAGCNWETDKRLYCGDGKKADEEACDGADLGDATCKGLGYGGGTLQCDSACKLDTSSCSSRGNGKVDGSDVCDGKDLAKKTCKDLGFKGGTLA